MKLSNTHPCYVSRLPEWEMLEDAFEGEIRVKSRGQSYLPPTSGMRADGMNVDQEGYRAYQAYLLRAVFPELVSGAVDAMVGLMHRKPANIKLPEKMRPLLQSATIDGESLLVLLRKINENQLLFGRIGILADVPSGGGPNSLPFIVPYTAKAILNWSVTKDPQGHDQLTMACLDESGPVLQDDLSWKDGKKQRIIACGETARMLGLPSLDYTTASSEDDAPVDASQFIIPSLAGKTLPVLPFRVIGSTDLVADPDKSPLLGVMRLCMAIYRGEADYRQTLFMQGQATLVRKGVTGGENEQQRIGAGAMIDVPSDGDAKYICAPGESLSEQRQALENDYKRAAESGAQLLEARGKAAESGDALRVRVAARTATLANVAATGAEGLQELLKIMAVWMGENPDEVKIEPNLDFTEDENNVQDLVYIMDARERGIPWSLESIHEWLKRHDYTKMEFADEMLKIKDELPAAKSILGPAPASKTKQGPGASN
jgi:hypothetical protein